MCRTGGEIVPLQRKHATDSATTLVHNLIYTTDNQLNAKPVVKQRHPGDEFAVSQRGSTKGKQSTNMRV